MQKMQTKNGSDHATSGPLFISASSFDLFPAHLLTLLLIGGRRVVVPDSFPCKRPVHLSLYCGKQICQSSIIPMLFPDVVLEFTYLLNKGTISMSSLSHCTETPPGRLPPGSQSGLA